MPTSVKPSAARWRWRRQKINEAGGYGGQPVVLVPADEGVAGVGIDPAIATLLDAGVDAIIGPASSINALAGLGEIVDAGVVACSPTASASLLDDFPDRNLFFRTIPSDSLQALAIGEAVDRTGASRATVAYIDDAYGQLFADSVARLVADKGIKQTDSVPYSADNQSIRPQPQKVASIAAGVVVVIGDATSGPVMLGAIDADEPVDAAGLRRQRRDAPPHRQRRADGRFAGEAGHGHVADRVQHRCAVPGRTRRDARQPQPVRGQRIRLRQPDRPGRLGRQLDAAGSDRRDRSQRSATAARRA